MSEGVKEEKEELKSILQEIHQRDGEIGDLKERFKEVLRNVEPMEIAVVEQELMEEGLPASEITKMCEVHVDLFRESVAEKYDLTGLHEVHPLIWFYKENEKIREDAEKLGILCKGLRKEGVSEENLRQLAKLGRKLSKVGRTHYKRLEELVFPYVERRGMTAVPEVLWKKHDETRGSITKLLNLIKDWQSKESSVQANKILDAGDDASQEVIDDIFKENNIFYPTVKELLTDEEWFAIHEQSNQVGYYGIEPPGWEPEITPKQPYEISGEIGKEEMENLPEHLKAMVDVSNLTPDDYELAREGDQKLQHGFLNLQELNGIFSILPIGISFVDKDDRLRFFSGGGEVFSRTKTVLGRPVQHCHPPKSVPIVNRILDEFKAGNKDHAEFWIQMGPKFVYIQYFPLRNEEGEYLGTLEVDQDVKKIRELEGEKRLLDWDQSGPKS